MVDLSIAMLVHQRVASEHLWQDLYRTISSWISTQQDLRQVLSPEELCGQLAAPSKRRKAPLGWQLTRVWICTSTFKHLPAPSNGCREQSWYEFQAEIATHCGSEVKIDWNRWVWPSASKFAGFFLQEPESFVLGARLILMRRRTRARLTRVTLKAGFSWSEPPGPGIAGMAMTSRHGLRRPEQGRCGRVPASVELLLLLLPCGAKWSHRRSDDRDSILADLDEEPDFSAAIKLQLDIIPVGKKCPNPPCAHWTEILTQSHVIFWRVDCCLECVDRTLQYSPMKRLEMGKRWSIGSGQSDLRMFVLFFKDVWGMWMLKSDIFHQNQQVIKQLGLGQHAEAQ